MIRPQVRPQVSAPDLSARGPFDGQGQVRPAHLLPSHDAVELRVGTAVHPAKELGKRKGEKGSHIGHDILDTMPLWGRVKPSAPYSLGEQILHAWGMMNPPNHWPQRDVYRTDLEEYLDRTGKTQEIFCEEVTDWLVKSSGKRDSLSLSHLRNCLYRKDKTLSFDVLKASSAIFHKSVTNYIDDPGAAVVGQDMSQESEEDRFFNRMLIKGASAKDLTSEQKQYVIEDLFRTLARIRALSAPGMVQPRENPPGVQPDVHADLPGGSPRRAPRPKR